MIEIPWMPLAAQLAMGFSLAACAGIRAFLPLLAVGIAGRLGFLPLEGAFGSLASNEALVVLSVATVLELLGDKVPLLDHVLDAAGIVLKPAAGILLAAAPLAGMDPKWRLLFAVAAGSTVAGAVHLTKAKLRLLSTIGTAGLANPLVSAAEDLVGIAGVAAALLVPLLAAAAALATAMTAAVLLVRWIGRPARVV